MANSTTQIETCDRISVLPFEIHQLILKYINSKPRYGPRNAGLYHGVNHQDLYNLCLVSHQFRSLAAPWLYQSLNIKCPDLVNPRLTLLKRFSPNQPQDHNEYELQYVRDLTLTAQRKRPVLLSPRRNANRTSCWHEAVDNTRLGKTHYDRTHSRIVWAGDAATCDLPKQEKFYDNHFHTFCRSLKDNSLRGFRWDLQACIPLDVIGPDGYMIKHQQSLERLEISTDWYCEAATDALKQYELSQLRNIRHFSFAGSQYWIARKPIIGCLAANASHLEVLKLAAWSLPSGGSRDLVNDLYNIGQTSGNEHCFPALQELSISCMPLYNAIDMHMAVFPFSQLRKLKMSNCHGITELLHTLATTTQTSFQLERLELMYESFMMSSTDQPGLVNLKQNARASLQRCPNLRDLFIHIPSLQQRRIASALKPAVGTVKRIIIHKRPMTLNPRLDGANEATDTLWCLSHFEFVGTCQDPKLLMSEITTTMTQPQSSFPCQFLHIRECYDLARIMHTEDFPRYSKNIHIIDFANWVFSGGHFPHLRILAFGDFYMQKRYDLKDVAALFCRSDQVDVLKGARLLSPDDTELWELVHENMDALTACSMEWLC